MKRATIIELGVVDKILPLVSGYLTTYALEDPTVADAWNIDGYDAPIAIDRGTLVTDLEGRHSDVYALSCYLWNMGLVTWLLERLRRTQPQAQFILGGPQVMNHAADYISPHHGNIAVCNTEGEVPFRAFLRELATDEPDLLRVPGLSFWRSGTLVTTEPPPRIRQLDDIPSPFLSGMYPPGKYTFAILETNRGCPYKCGFCFWGAATNSRVNTFALERILRELTWMSENGVVTLFIADANWGILPRDVEITDHIVACARRTGFPLVVAINSAKNKPDRVIQITKTLAHGGLLTSQPVSLQTTDAHVLDVIDRGNIKLEAYAELQRALQADNISSFVEMIWPLPGETLATFRKGLTDLCRSGADTILVYPHLLLHNTPIYDKRSQLGVVTERVPDPAAEADVVVSTDTVARAAYDEGVWTYYAAQLLYNFRGLYYLANWLDASGIITFGDLFAAAAAALRERTASRISQFVSSSVGHLSNYYLLNSGELAHMVLFSHRDEFDDFLLDFVQSQLFSADPGVTAALELDLVARPYIYRSSLRPPRYNFQFLEVDRPRNGFLVCLPSSLEGLIRTLHPDLVPTTNGARLTVELTHPARRKLPFLVGKPLRDNIEYCQTMTLHLREILPEFATVS
jgi:radical SAM superfamily enzyme YgiQ (UPF0313 family)